MSVSAHERAYMRLRSRVRASVRAYMHASIKLGEHLYALRHASSDFGFKYFDHLSYSCNSENVAAPSITKMFWLAVADLGILERVREHSTWVIALVNTLGYSFG